MQQELAEALNRLAATNHNRHLTLTKKSVYRWESGETESPKRLYQRLLAEYFGVPITELGLPPSPVPGQPTARHRQRYRRTRAAGGQPGRGRGLAAVA